MESEEAGDNVEAEVAVTEEQEAEDLEIPVSHIQSDENFDGGNVLQLQVRGKYYKQTYRSAWEQMPDFKGWLRGVQGEPTRAYCTFCQKTLHAHRLSLLKHTCTIRHQKAAQLHNSRKIKKALSESDLSSDDEGTKINDKSDPEFSPKNHKTNKPTRIKVKVEPTKRNKRRSYKNSDFEYEFEDNEPPSSPEYKYKLPPSIIDLKKKKGLDVGDCVPAKKNSKNMPSSKKGSVGASVKDEVSDAITELQRLSDSIQVREDDEFDLFGKYIASQLKQLSLVKALRAKQRIYSFLSDLRLAEIHEASNAMVTQGSVPVAYISVPSTVTTVSTPTIPSTTMTITNNNLPSTSSET